MAGMSAFCVVMTSVGGREQARSLGAAVLDEKLAACVQVMPIESHYLWQDERRCDEEYLLLMKAQRSDYAALEALILRHHAYELPEIICLDIAAGFAPYLAWMSAQTTRV
jgi:periplasmic divalent cation tolerance protein